MEKIKDNMIVTFDTLDLTSESMKAVEDMGFEEASPIQARAIPVMKSGCDLIGQAQTGTGKTAAFGLPLLEKINPKNRKLQGIVLCPTRELAIQVAEEIRSLAKYRHEIKVLPIYGGQEIVKQIRALKSGTQLIIGTPGRVMDHMERKTIRMDQVHTVVLDEADEMLNMGFREDIEMILKEVPKERQTVLFSATMPKTILEISRRFQNNAQLVRVTPKELTVQNIEQFYYDIKGYNKVEILSRLLDMYTPKLSLVFCNTKKQVDILVNELLGLGYSAAGLHGDLKQSQRDRVMHGFRRGTTDVLVATDVAARGIDVDDVEAVFNYDLPQDAEYYVHRIGRTGRAGRIGRSFTFVSRREMYRVKEIQQYCKTKIHHQRIPSENDVAKMKMNLIFAQVEQLIKEDNLDVLQKTVERRLMEGGYSATEMATAFLKLATGANKSIESDKEFANTGASEEGMVRLFLSIGKKHRARPGDIVGALAGESDMPGAVIGMIDMREKYSFVEIPKEYVKNVIHGMNKQMIRGKAVAIELATASGA